MSQVEVKDETANMAKEEGPEADGNGPSKRAKLEPAEAKPEVPHSTTDNAFSQPGV